MQMAEQRLETLGKISKQHPDHVFHRVYRELFNKGLFLRAYLKLAPNEGNMTKGVDGKTIDGFGMRLVDELIEELRAERFHPKPSRREYITKANGKLRPLGIPSFRDKLVQEALREVLEAIYEPTFSDNSHGFRPNRSCHTALNSIQYGCAGSVWVLNGDIVGFFDNIDHGILLDLISKKVKDGRVIELIRRFLKAGYMEDGSFKDTELGSPQGTGLSPLLANIYLNELDVFVEGLEREFVKGKARKPNKEYLHWKGKRIRALRRADKEEADMAFKHMQSLPYGDPIDPDFVRIAYRRYADDWCMFFISDLKLVKDVKSRISRFLSEHLHLKLSEEKTHITNLKDENTEFLGYEIGRVNGKTSYCYQDGVRKRGSNCGMTLLMPQKAVTKRTRPLTQNGKPIARNELLDMDVETIIKYGASEMNGVYNYYCLASNVAKRMNDYKRIHYPSLLRTLAKKERSSIRQVLRKYGMEVPRADGRGTYVTLGLMKGGEKVAWYPHNGFRKRKFAPPTRSDSQKEYGKELRQRILAEICEVCNDIGQVEVHHIRNLSNTVDRYSKKGSVPDWVRLMHAMNRKTLVLCPSCHRKLHSNKLVIPSVHGGA